ncbi:hypothetical protein, partial [Paramylibacter ulvae]|uniref:hypothetical protein n=1 Tax=Paramylibacter ulvae TaxID=1651968 RepID=UPI001E37C825
NATPSISAACNTSEKRHNQINDEPEPPLIYKLTCSNLSDDGQRQFSGISGLESPRRDCVLRRRVNTYDTRESRKWLANLQMIFLGLPILL